MGDTPDEDSYDVYDEGVFEELKSLFQNDRVKGRVRRGRVDHDKCH